ncbi:MAG: GDP-mannose 4,6-dehydratase [Gemmatimonadales bacterium]|nr:GDP-mannose 4,6-dehydratase [Gemmatimonadales bacterium]
MKLLITGADGFVGRWLVRAARNDGHDVVAAVLPGATVPTEWHDEGAVVSVMEADILDASHLDRIAATRPDAVVHLAAVASGSAARRDPDAAMRVNAVASADLVAAVGHHGSGPRFLHVSTGEVYGGGHTGMIAEDAPLNPASPYAASKATAEESVLARARTANVDVVIARPFPHTGPGQADTYVLPALANRLIEARRTGEGAIRTGNLDPVRDFLDVRDVVGAYLLLLEHGVSGEAYNVASGVGRQLSECFSRLAELVDVAATAEQDAALLRPGDIAVLIGNPAKLHAATGWSPRIPFDRTLQDLVDAQAH